MNKITAIKYFGSVTKLADALNLTVGAISQWKAEQIPELRARQLEDITQGALKFDRSQSPLRQQSEQDN